MERTLTAALGAGGAGLVAFVGAGGKTTALQRLVVELAGATSGVIATTTTAMFGRELASLGPLVLAEGDAAGARARCREALSHAAAVALAAHTAPAGKVKGLAPEEVDQLWARRPAGSIVVEADGSRGLPLKAFGAAEPQLPRRTSLAVVVAGLDVLGTPLDAAHVHRAELLEPLMAAAMGVAVTPSTLAQVVALQVRRVRELVPAASVAVLLNKADTAQLAAAGEQAASLLLEPAGELGRPADPGGVPDRVVVGSLSQGVYRVVPARTVEP